MSYYQEEYIGNLVRENAELRASLEAIRAEEREACAKRIRGLYSDYVWCDELCEAIRARGDGGEANDA